MSSFHIDSMDQRILSFLVNDARRPLLEIARECGISGAAVHQRVRKMERNGLITGSRLIVKPGILGLNVCAFIGISLSENNKYVEVVEKLKKIPEVVECHFVTGKYALLVKIYCINNEHLMNVIVNTMQNIPYIQGTETQISLQEPIERHIWVNEYENTHFSMNSSRNQGRKGDKDKKTDSSKKKPSGK